MYYPIGYEMGSFFNAEDAEVYAEERRGFYGEIQYRLARYWDDDQQSSGQGGKIYTDVPCRTNKQGRSPDVAYLTPELIAQFGNAATLLQSFPLCAEIVSPTYIAENVLLKAQEYLESGGEEVWLVFPESRWVMILTAN